MLQVCFLICGLQTSVAGRPACGCRLRLTGAAGAEHQAAGATRSQPHHKNKSVWRNDTCRAQDQHAGSLHSWQTSCTHIPACSLAWESHVVTWDRTKQQRQPGGGRTRSYKPKNQPAQNKTGVEVQILFLSSYLPAIQLYQISLKAYYLKLHHKEASLIWNDLKTSTKQHTNTETTDWRILTMIQKQRG